MAVEALRSSIDAGLGKRFHAAITKSLELLASIHTMHGKQLDRRHILCVHEQSEGIVGGRNGAAAQLGSGSHGIDLQNAASGYQSRQS